MSGFLALVWFAANVVMIVFIVKTVKEKDAEQKKQKRKIWLICLAVAFVSLFAFTLTDDSSDTKEEPETEVSADEESEDASDALKKINEETDVAENDIDESNTEKQDADSTETSDLSKEDEIELVLAVAEVSLKDSFGSDNYDLTYKDNMVTVNVWQDGVAAGASYVKAGVLSKTEWTNMCDNIKYMADSLYDGFKPYGVDVTVNVLNDQNKENVLLTYFNGTKIYDCLEE